MFFSSYCLAHASLVINEVMYDLSGSDSTSGKSREWIEIYNPDSSDVFVDASEWRIYDGSANRTINGEIDFSVPTQSYVIFAGDKDTFLADNPGFSGTVYDTGITSLNNTGATLKLIDQDGNTVDQFAYASSEGGAGDGNSLQKVSGSWVGAIPTPGIDNDTSSVSGGSGGGSSGGVTQTNAIETKKQTVTEEPKIKTKIVAKNIVLVGNPLSFQITTLGYNKEKLSYGRYFINFGDGDSKEIQVSSVESGGKLTHTYSYPGDYVMSLEYYMNSYGYTPDASDQMTIRVTGSNIVISSVGDDRDFFVELTNNTDYDADISGWILSGSSGNFTFPRNTILGSKRKLIISSRLTHFTILDKNSLKLMNAQWQVVFESSVTSSSVARITFDPAESLTPIKKITTVVMKDEKETPALNDLTKDLTLPIIVPAEELGALVSSSDVIKKSTIPYVPALAFIFIGVSAGAVYFVRRRGVISKIGDDFKILDE